MISRDDIRVKARERINKEKEEFEKKSQDRGKKQNRNAGQGDSAFRFMGHRRQESTARYAKVAAEFLKEVLDCPQGRGQ